MFCKWKIQQKTFTRLSLVPYHWYYRLMQVIGDQDLVSTFLKEVFEDLTVTSKMKVRTRKLWNIWKGWKNFQSVFLLQFNFDKQSQKRRGKNLYEHFRYLHKDWSSYFVFQNDFKWGTRTPSTELKIGLF